MVLMGDIAVLGSMVCPGGLTCKLKILLIGKTFQVNSFIFEEVAFIISI